MTEKVKDSWDRTLIVAQIFAYAAAPFVILAVTLIANHQLKERETSVQELTQAIAVLAAQNDEQKKKELRSWADAVFKRAVASTKSNDGGLIEEWMKVAAAREVMQDNAAVLCRRPSDPLMKKAEVPVKIPGEDGGDIPAVDVVKLFLEQRYQYERLALYHNALIASLERSCGYLQRAVEAGEAEKK